VHQSGKQGRGEGEKGRNRETGKGRNVRTKVGSDFVLFALRMVYNFYVFNEKGIQKYFYFYDS